MDEYKYADKSRERRRIQKLIEEKQKHQSDKRHKYQQLLKGPWSAKKLAKQRKKERKFKKAKKELLKRKADDISNRINKNNDIDNEWQELQKEERLAKKLKKRKIEKEEFEKETEL